MRRFLSFAFFLAVGSPMVSGILSTPAYADSYVFYNLGPANVNTPYGITTNGTAVITNVSCSNTGAICYDTYVGGALTTASTIMPGLVYDNGSACVLAPPAGTTFSSGRCNGGYDAIVASGGLYTGLTGMETEIYSGLSIDSLLLNSVGDVLFVNANSEQIFEAVKITPEPSTLALLGTGALGLLGVLKRRMSEV